MTPSSRLLPNRALLHRTKSFGSRISNEKALTFTVRPYPTSTTIAMSNKNSPESPMVSQDFFNYTSGRWIYNEKQQLDARRIDFSVDGLKKVASNLALNVSDESFEMIKLREGLFNRAFLLSNKDGTEVIARLPTTLAGPKRLTMASEVATMKLLKAIGFPVPTVFSYSCCEENDVGSEYILMERAEGIPLSSVWAKMGRKRRGQVVTQLIELDAKLLALNLSGYGSIYMNGDLPESSVIPLSTDPSLCNYRLGPSVERSWWAEERKTMAIGTQLTDVLAAKAIREISWIESYAQPHSTEDVFRRSESQEDPHAHIDLLQQYLTLVPLLAKNVVFEQPVLLHMDLHLANIFIKSEKQPSITAIIDWQGAEILPLSLTARFPRMLDYDIGEEPVTVDMPPELDSLDPVAKANREDVMVKKYWLAKTIKINPQMAAALREPIHKLLIPLWIESGRTWTGELASFRHDLIEFVDTYENCPVSFSQEERSHHKEEVEEYNDKIIALKKLREALGVSSEGWVSHERYDTVMQVNEELKREIAEEASNGDEELRQDWERWWPFSDR